MEGAETKGILRLCFHAVIYRKAGRRLFLWELHRGVTRPTHSAGAATPFFSQWSQAMLCTTQVWLLRTGWPRAGRQHGVLLASSHQTHRLPGKADRAALFL